ncbi:uncharacterized protein [Diadema setosum]|uniref:uncharacterized protein n=1 Tax=Diadema setosum TaxID=31175 RepID=UPI003B3AB55E
MVFAAPTLLDQLMDVNTADEADENIGGAHDFDKREAMGFDDGLDTLLRQRRMPRGDQCVINCWNCIKAFHKNSINLGSCITGCSGLTTRKMLTSPMDAQSWSRCATHYRHQR